MQKELVLHRYTSLPVALDVLLERRLTLLSPETWDDRNDSYYLERYREKKKLKTLLAICFSVRGETFHHWKVFSSGSSGVCITFGKDQLLKAFPATDGYHYKMMEYRLVKTVIKSKPEIERWPFLKRKAFKDEGEFRIIYENVRSHELIKHVDIDLSTIKRITLSPWLQNGVTKSVQKLITSIKGCESLSINRSPLIDTAGWKKAIE